MFKGPVQGTQFRGNLPTNTQDLGMYNTTNQWTRFINSGGSFVWWTGSGVNSTDGGSGNISDFDMSVTNGNLNVKGNITARNGITGYQTIPDTRNEVKPPSQYPVGVTTELKNGDLFGLKGFMALTTRRPWAGLDVKTFQTAETNYGPYVRSSVANTDTWERWYRLVTDTTMPV